MNDGVYFQPGIPLPSLQRERIPDMQGTPQKQRKTYPLWI